MEKALTKFMKGRTRIAVVMMVCLVAIVALPAMAHAASFASAYPAVTIYSQPAVVSVDVLGATLNTKGATISVGGTVYPATVMQGADAGSWASTDVLWADGYYHTQWTWAASAVGNKATLYVYPNVALPLGPVAVSASAKDAAGAVVGPNAWSFTIAAQPIVTPPIPPSAALNVCTDCHFAGSTDVPAQFAVDYSVDNAMGPNCLTCHTGGYGAHFFSGDAAASGHNTRQEGRVGAYTKFDGSQGPTLEWESEIATTAASYQTNLGVASVTTGQVGTLKTNWTFPTQSVFWPAGDPTAPATAVKGLSSTSVIGCEDCHTGFTAAGPHGASANWGLDANYPGDYSYAELTKYVTANNAFPTWDARYNTALSVSGIAMFPGAATHSDITSASVASTVGVAPFDAPPAGMTNPAMSSGNVTRTDGTTGATAVICAKCHKLEVYISAANGGVNAVEGANTAHDSHHQDQTDGSPQCVNCHVGIPHAWKRPRLLVNTDADTAPMFDPQALGTTRATSTGEVNVGDTRKLTAGFGQGFNRQGMQSLSGWDQHTLATATAGHQGQAAWTEASCQACGDHAGEDGVRITEE